MPQLDQMNRVELGERLRKARRSTGLSQASVAAALSVSRPTLVAIESGKRRVRFDEIEAFAKCYATSVNHLLADDAVHIDLCPRLRSGTHKPEAASQAVALLNKLASSTLEIERLLGIHREPVIPPEQRIARGLIDHQAEEAALTFRHWLGVGLTPIMDIVSLLQDELGASIFIRNIHSSISGVFGYDPAVGACILLNANHSRERQAMTAAHEIGHFVSNRSFGDIVVGSEDIATDEERFANVFAYAFLMPAPAVRRQFQELVEVNRKFTPRHLGFMAAIFYVSIEAICRRLESLKLLPRGTFESLRDRGFTARAAQSVHEPGTEEPAVRPFRSRMMHLAASALFRGLLSEGQLSRMLDLDRVDVRRVLEEIAGCEEDEIAIPLD